MSVRRVLLVGLAVAGLGVGAVPAGAVTSGAAVTASGSGVSAPSVAKPRARLTGTMRVTGSGRVLVTVASDARRVVLSWRTAENTTRVAILTLRKGRAAGYIPAGSTQVVARAKATATRRASVRVTLGPVTPTPDSPADTTAPGAITGLTVAGLAASTATLGWANPTDADLAAIVVRRSRGTSAPATSAAGSSVRLSAATATGVTDTGLTPGVTYSYAIFATDAAGNTSAPATVTVTTTPAPTPSARPVDLTNTALPAASGQGRRIVWSPPRNRVWVVDAGEVVVRTFPVTDNDDKVPPGTYKVLRKSATSYTSPEYGSLVLPYFLGFHKRCASCAYIGFHQIPIDATGKPLEPESGLGSPQYQSHGCVRLSRADAHWLFDFAALDTPVIVVA